MTDVSGDQVDHSAFALADGLDGIQHGRDAVRLDVLRLTEKARLHRALDSLAVR